MLQILYLAQDLADPAVRRRILTLVAGGANVSLAGFRRDANALAAIHGVEPIELGVTKDGRFAQRVGAVAKACLTLKGRLAKVGKPDIIIARNLEMLAIARRARMLFDGAVPIVYECLDIHRLLTREDIAGRAIRATESYLGRDTRLLITSSPAFVEHYFHKMSGLDAPAMLLENKVLEIDAPQRAAAVSAECPRPGEPWKIGWFGALRCRKSLALLADFSRKMDGRFEIILRGRPAYSEFEDFDGFVRNEPFMRFEGAYRNPEDLARIYGEVHFTWAIDFFEEGQNSAWLLPNRLYEGCRHGRIPIAMKGTETARFLSVRRIGLVLEEADADSLVSLVGTMTPDRYIDAIDRVARCNRGTWVFDRADCEALVRSLSTLTRNTPKAVSTAHVSEPRHNEGGLL